MSRLSTQTRNKPMTDFFSDLDDGLAGAGTLPAADIRKAAHIANGGDATFSCPKCNGSGMTRWGACFKCKSTGKITGRQVAAAKGKETQMANASKARLEFAEANLDVIDFLAANQWSDFYRSLWDQYSERGSLSDRQLAAVRSGMEKAKAREAEKAKAQQANSGA